MKTSRWTPQPRQDLRDRRQHAQDRQVYQRLSAVLWSDAGRPREEIAALLGVSSPQVGPWVRIVRNTGRDGLGTLPYPGDPGRLGPAPVERLQQEIATGACHHAEPVRTGVHDALGGADAIAGLQDLLRRIGASDHQVSGFFGKADVREQKRFVRKSRRQKREAGPGTRRDFGDACHRVWGGGLLDSCGLLVGPRFYVGVGNGRKRRNSLGASSPDDHDSVDLRLTRENLTGEPFLRLLEAWRAKHPQTRRFLLYLDHARYSSKPVVRQWLAHHREFRLVPRPASSPTLNRIERRWKFLRKTARNRGPVTIEAMPAAVAKVRDRLGEDRDELATLLTERFAIVEVEQAGA